MFDQLLDQLEDALSDAQQTRGLPKSRMTPPPPFDGPAQDPTMQFGAAMSFGKSQRFKQLEKQELKTSHIQWDSGKRDQSMISTGFSFRKGERFQAEKPKYNQVYINPNYSAVKKNANPVPIYKKPSPKDLGKSNVSVSTVASQSFRGPGRYHVQEQKTVRNAAFSKGKRFEAEKKKYEDIPLMINENQTRKRPPTAALLKKKIKKTKHLISRQQQQDLRERLKMVYWKNVPLELDRMFKNSTGPVLRQDYFDLSRLRGVQRRAALYMMMNRMNEMRGGFEQDIRTGMEAPCGVVYRKSTPKPFKFSEMEPGPDYYCPDDAIIKPNPIGFSFAHAGIVWKRPQKDTRDYDISEELMKKGGNIIINPEHKPHRLSEEQIRSLNRGPGFYDCLFKQVQKRDDIGVVKFPQLKMKNDRQNNCIEIKEVCDGIYFPQYSALDPNVPAPIYKQKADVKPQHTPEKDLFPQHWLFYDGDLNKVRAQIAKNVLLAKNMDFKEYKQHATKFKRFKEYLELQRKGPEAGQYQVAYKAIDAHVQGVDIGKQQEKELIDPIVKPEGDADGDNLILHPKDFEDHLPNMDFKKMQGREMEQIDRNGEARQGDRLIISPRKPEKHIANVDFKKQEGRPEMNEAGDSEEGPQGDVLILHPKPVQKHIANVDFSKQAERPQIRTEKDDLEIVNDINPAAQPSKVKGVPFSRLSSVRMVPLLRNKENQAVGEQGEQDQ